MAVVGHQAAGRQAEAPPVHLDRERLQPLRAPHVVVGLLVALQGGAFHVAGRGHTQPGPHVPLQAGRAVPVAAAVVFPECSAGVLGVVVGVLAAAVAELAGGVCLQASPPLRPPRPRLHVLLVEALVVVVDVERHLSGQPLMAVVQAHRRLHAAAVGQQQEVAHPAVYALQAAVGAVQALRGPAVVHVEGVVVLRKRIVGAGAQLLAACEGERGEEGGAPCLPRALRQAGPEMGSRAEGVGLPRGEPQHGGGRSQSDGAEQASGVEQGQFHGLHALYGEAVHVGLSAAGLVERQPVYGHGGVGGAHASDAYGLEAAGASVVAQVYSRQTAQGVARVGHTAQRHLGRRELLGGHSGTHRSGGPRSRHLGGGKGVRGCNMA